MDRIDVGAVRIEGKIGDIAAQDDLDAVVNAANAQLTTGGGVAGAIHRAAGPGLSQECRPMAPIAPGQCVISGGHNLPNGSVIHCLGPVYGQDEPAEQLLTSCYSRALQLADEHALSSLGFPAISTGAFGYPMQQGLQVAVSAVSRAAPELSNVRLVRFVFYAEDDLDTFREVLAARGSS